MICRSELDAVLIDRMYQVDFFESLMQDYKNEATKKIDAFLGDDSSAEFLRHMISYFIEEDYDDALGLLYTLKLTKGHYIALRNDSDAFREYIRDNGV
jgi:hypothetical protein